MPTQDPTPVHLIEAECQKCGQVFNPADETDVVHNECGGTGRIVGVYYAEKPTP